MPSRFTKNLFSTWSLSVNKFEAIYFYERLSRFVMHIAVISMRIFLCEVRRLEIKIVINLFPLNVNFNEIMLNRNKPHYLLYHAEF